MVKNNNTVLKLGQKISFGRKKLNLTQEKFAELADLNTNSVSMIERGKVNSTVETLEKIANALDVEVQELFDFKL